MRTDVFTRGAAGCFRAAPLRAFKSEDAAFSVGAWFAALNGHRRAADWCEKAGLAVVNRAMSEGINSAGGALVPPGELIKAIISLREQYGVVRRRANVVPMGGEIATIPRRRTGPSAYWVTDGTAITDGSALTNWDNIGLTAQKLGALLYTSSELVEDALIDIGEALALEVGTAFAKKEDDAAFIGDGTSTYAGYQGVSTALISATSYAGSVVAASGHDTYAEIDMADLATLIGTLPGYAFDNAGWYCTSKFFGFVLCRLAGAAGGIVAVPDRDGIIKPHFMGWPVEITQSMPAVATTTTDQSGACMCLFGDLKKAVTLGDRREITVARSELGPATFTADIVGWKFSERVAINTAGLGDATTAGAIVSLVGE